MLARALSILLLAGCAPAQSPPPTPPTAPSAPPVREPAPVATPVEVEPPIAAETPPPPEPTTPPEATSPAAAVPTRCELREPDWDTITPRVLRSPSGRAYATIVRADELKFVVEGRATAEFTTHGLRLRTRPRPGDLPVYARGELAFAGVLQAGKGTPLVWSPAAGPRLRVAPRKDRRVRFVADPAVEVGCETLTTLQGYSDLAAPDHQLRARGPIAVAAAAGGPPVLHLHLARAVEVKQLEAAGTQVKISWSITDGALAAATVTGWVDARVVAPPPEGTAGYGLPGAALGFEGTSHWSGCGAEHPLYVDAGRGPEPVGEILAGTRVQRGERRGKFVVVDIVGPAVRSTPTPVRLRAGAKFMLTAADTAECTRGS